MTTYNSQIQILKTLTCEVNKKKYTINDNCNIDDLINYINFVLDNDCYNSGKIQNDFFQLLKHKKIKCNDFHIIFSDSPIESLISLDESEQFFEYSNNLLCRRKINKEVYIGSKTNICIIRKLKNMTFSNILKNKEDTIKYYHNSHSKIYANKLTIEYSDLELIKNEWYFVIVFDKLSTQLARNFCKKITADELLSKIITNKKYEKLCKSCPLSKKKIYQKYTDAIKKVESLKNFDLCLRQIKNEPKDLKLTQYKQIIEHSQTKDLNSNFIDLPKETFKKVTLQIRNKQIDSAFFKCAWKMEEKDFVEKYENILTEETLCYTYYLYSLSLEESVEYLLNNSDMYSNKNDNYYY